MDGANAAEGMAASSHDAMREVKLFSALKQ